MVGECRDCGDYDVVTVTWWRWRGDGCIKQRESVFLGAFAYSQKVQLNFMFLRSSVCATSRTVSGSIPGGVTGDFFRSYRQNHVPWGRLSL